LIEIKIQGEKMCEKIPFKIWLSGWQRSLRKDHVLYEYHVFLNYFLLIKGTGKYSCPTKTAAY